MQWFRNYLLLSAAVAVSTWVCLYFTDAWYYVQYDGKADPRGLVVEVPAWEQATASCLIGLLAAVPIVGLALAIVRLSGDEQNKIAKFRQRR